MIKKRFLIILISFLIMFTLLDCFCQGRYNDYKTNYVFSIFANKYTVTHGFSFFPKNDNKNNGFVLNFISNRFQINNGLYVEIPGNGLLDVFLKKDYYLQNSSPKNTSSSYNGISFSLLGLNSDGQVNGLSINGVALIQEKLNGLTISGGTINSTKANGLMISGISSKIGEMKGLQISIDNVVVKGKGVSIGFTNVVYEYKGCLIGFLNFVDGKLRPIIYVNFKD